MISVSNYSSTGGGGGHVCLWERHLRPTLEIGIQ